MSSPWRAAADPHPTDEWGTPQGSGPVPVDAPVEAHVLPSAEVVGRHYPSLGEWVTKWLADIYRVPKDTTHRSWCPEWWRHGGATYRLWRMWDAWEVAEAEGGAAPSEWLLSADLHMAQLLAPDGPFKGCSKKKGHQGSGEPLLWEVPPPPEWSMPLPDPPEPLGATSAEVTDDPTAGSFSTDPDQGDI